MVKNKLFIVVPVVYMLVSFLLVYVLDRETTDSLTAEDHLVEYLGAIALFVSSILFFLIFVHLTRTKNDVPRLHKLAYLGLALLFFFGGGEEIAWGQRILGIETPESIESVNVQGDTTIHNLEIFQGENKLPIGVGEMFGFFSLVLTFIIPVSAYLFAPLRKFYERFTPVFPWIFGFLFAANWALAKIGGMIYRSGREVTYGINNMVEVKESNYAIFYATIAIYMYLLVVKSSSTETYAPQPDSQTVQEQTTSF